MQVVLKQKFPLGRFHATPWRVNPFDDPYGEWPPSPWRLVRAVVARWYQWAREASEQPNARQLEDLVRSFCASSYAFHLPVTSGRGNPLRQYFPQEFGWNPKEKKKAGLRSYGTSLAQDNYWCVPNDDADVWWFLSGDHWNDSVLAALDRCLERVVYFGRAESFTRIRRVRESAVEPNCSIMERRVARAVPVLVPSADATLADVERVTDDPQLAGRTVPLGAQWLYAVRPPRPTIREKLRVRRAQSDCTLMQFALGWNVAPEPRAIVRLTSRFRGAVIRELLIIKTADPNATWSRAPVSVRDAVAQMTGKDSEGRPLIGPHRHTEFHAWFEDEIATRLLVWRDAKPFDEDEQTAILNAASRALSWAASGAEADAWNVRLIPLDRAVPPPPGFDGNPAGVWESMTPYVPPRHYLRGGKPRPRESLEAQIQRELALRAISAPDEVHVARIGKPTWVSAHVPRSKATQRSFLGDRRGYWCRLTFVKPVNGPLRLGHSSSFGLGLFRPVPRVQT